MEKADTLFIEDLSVSIALTIRIPATQPITIYMQNLNVYISNQSIRSLAYIYNV
jgi:hypothetical protein